MLVRAARRRFVRELHAGVALAGKAIARVAFFACAHRFAGTATRAGCVRGAGGGLVGQRHAGVAHALPRIFEVAFVALARGLGCGSVRTAAMLFTGSRLAFDRDAAVSNAPAVSGYVTRLAIVERRVRGLRASVA
jgi:hypothetical protein